MKTTVVLMLTLLSGGIPMGSAWLDVDRPEGAVLGGLLGLAIGYASGSLIHIVRLLGKAD